MELGGNIVLEGFDNTKPEQMIVIKKIAGSFAKKVSETKGEYEKVILNLENSYKIKIQVRFKDNELTAENEDKNLFFALTNSIKEIEAQF
jgi:ribosome-associated translation inhibitor RaiA